MPTLIETRTERDGVIRVEQWPEGLVLWVGGEVRWKQWAPITHTHVVRLDPENIAAIARAVAAVGER